MSEKRKVGRKPINDSAMTKAERMRRYREKLKDQGKVMMTVSISKKVIEVIDMYGREAGQTRGEALESVIEQFLEEWAKDYEAIDDLIKQRGGTND
jgi:type I site-specific restriction-modification system R (restriction) subunit